MHWRYIAYRAVRARWVGWLITAVALTLLYYAALLVAMVARFGELPNYVTLYEFLDAYARIWQSTPSTVDALRIMAEEPVFETGYLVPSFGVAEWSLTVVMPNLVQVLLVAVLAATFAAVWREARCTACPTCKAGAAAAGAGVGILGLCSACLTWVVCCATPSWIVALSLLGVSLSVAEAVQPLDRLLGIIGMAMLVLAIAAQARRIAMLRSGSRQHEPDRGKRPDFDWRIS